MTRPDPKPDAAAQIVIDKGVPLPTMRMGRPIKYPIALLEVGESFFAPSAKINGVSGSLAKYRRKGLQFTVRTVTEGGVKGVRCWRFA